MTAEQPAVRNFVQKPSEPWQQWLARFRLNRPVEPLVFARQRSMTRTAMQGTHSQRRCAARECMDVHRILAHTYLPALPPPIFLGRGIIGHSAWDHNLIGKTAWARENAPRPDINKSLGEIPSSVPTYCMACILCGLHHAASHAAQSESEPNIAQSQTTACKLRLNCGEMRCMCMKAVVQQRYVHICLMRALRWSTMYVTTLWNC